MNSEKIMVIDDEPHMVDLIKAILENNFFKVLTASNGPDALAKLKTVKPDLILLDIMMPGMSGFDVCEKIRSQSKTKELKIIFLTALKLSTLDESYLRKLKACDYIVKPFDNDDLIKRIHRALIPTKV